MIYIYDIYIYIIYIYNIYIIYIYICIERSPQRSWFQVLRLRREPPGWGPRPAAQGLTGQLLKTLAGGGIDYGTSQFQWFFNGFHWIFNVCSIDVSGFSIEFIGFTMTQWFFNGFSDFSGFSVVFKGFAGASPAIIVAFWPMETCWENCKQIVEIGLKHLGETHIRRHGWNLISFHPKTVDGVQVWYTVMPTQNTHNGPLSNPSTCRCSYHMFLSSCKYILNQIKPQCC